MGQEAWWLWVLAVEINEVLDKVGNEEGTCIEYHPCGTVCDALVVRLLLDG